jgi:hypothetical protein
VTKQQALALMNALEANKVASDAQLRFDNAGAESWTVVIEPSATLLGPQLLALVNYCQANNLVLSAIFSQLGIT